MKQRGGVTFSMLSHVSGSVSSTVSSTVSEKHFICTLMGRGLTAQPPGIAQNRPSKPDSSFKNDVESAQFRLAREKRIAARKTPQLLEILPNACFKLKMVDNTDKYRYFLSKLKMADNTDTYRSNISFGPLAKDSSFTQEKFRWQLARHCTKSLRLGVFRVFLQCPPTGVSIVLSRTLHKAPCSLEFFSRPHLLHWN